MFVNKVKPNYYWNKNSLEFYVLRGSYIPFTLTVFHEVHEFFSETCELLRFLAQFTCNTREMFEKEKRKTMKWSWEETIILEEEVNVRQIVDTQIAYTKTKLDSFDILSKNSFVVSIVLVPPIFGVSNGYYPHQIHFIFSISFLLFLQINLFYGFLYLQTNVRPVRNSFYQQYKTQLSVSQLKIQINVERKTEWHALTILLFFYVFIVVQLTILTFYVFLCISISVHNAIVWWIYNISWWSLWNIHH